ncbi:MAG: permease [Bacteroidales bacterium]|nr:permease [Bacteroidales bacterium]MDY0286497.1 permease [Bacteroidales bacterium]
MEIFTQFIYEFLQSFWVLTREMAPWLLFGFLFAGVLKAWLPEGLIRKYLGKNNRFSVVNAALFGIPLPLCSCGVIPAGMSLYKNGADKGSTSSFLISTPQTGVDSIFATYSLLGLPFAVIRPVVALITGITGGAITRRWDPQNDSPPEAVLLDNRVTTTSIPLSNKLQEVFRYGFLEMIASIGKWLLIGLAVAALFAVLIPDDFFTHRIGQGLSGMLLILLASVPLYVCATGSIPIAAVLMLKGLSPGAALVFLMAGPATNAATISVIARQLGRKSLIIYLLSISVGALLAGLAIDFFLPPAWFFNPLQFHEGHTHQVFSGGFLNLSAALLIMLMTYVFIHTRYQKISKSNTTKNQGAITKIRVRGMTCAHCKAMVESALSSIDGIAEATATPKSGEVILKGNFPSEKKILEVIQRAGYQYEGKIK